MKKRFEGRFAIPSALAGVVLSLVVLAGAGCEGPGPTGEARQAEKNAPVVRIGSKNFTEQFILGEMMAQLLESKTSLVVERRFNLGGTRICHTAIVEGQIDLYPEYTGTALTAILKTDGAGDGGAFQRIRREYERRYELLWLEPFGLNNTYTLTVRREDAQKRRWETISDLLPHAGDLRAGFTAEFSERPDGYPGLKAAYGIGFGEVRDMDPGLLYNAIVEHAVDVISGFATDGRIPAYDLKSLEDDRGFFPRYDAAPVVRKAFAEGHRELRSVLGRLAGRIGNRDMQAMNAEVDLKKRSPEAVAREFLLRKGLL